MGDDGKIPYPSSLISHRVSYPNTLAVRFRQVALALAAIVVRATLSEVSAVVTEA